jgi:hypothetical protein
MRKLMKFYERRGCAIHCDSDRNINRNRNNDRSNNRTGARSAATYAKYIPPFT